MGLDKNNSNQYYLLGRFWAVVEMCNEVRFSPTQVDQLFLDPTSVWRFDLNKQRNTDLRQEILALAPADGWPQRQLTPSEASKVWVGYYHQKAYLEPKLEEI